MTVGRRRFLTAIAAATAMTQTRGARAATPDAKPVLSTALPDADTEIINLWTDTPPGGAGPDSEETLTRRGALKKISTPRLIVHKPQKPTGAAMLICSGGGYDKVDIVNESTPAAAFFASKGITAVELVYRVPLDGWSIQAPFMDGVRGLNVLSSQAKRLGIDVNRLGVLGFSAGGHLAGMLATGAAKAFYEPVDEIDEADVSPAFGALIYPVITMMPPFDKTHSRLRICGRHPVGDMRQEFSVEQHVTKHTPPIFLAHALDDPIVPVDHSLLMFQALRSAGVETEMHIFQSGGHGWGMGKTRLDVRPWPDLVENWLKLNKMIIV